MSPQEAASRDMASKYHYKMLCASEYSVDLCMLPWPLYFAMVNFAMVNLCHDHPIYKGCISCQQCATILKEIVCLYLQVCFQVQSMHLLASSLYDACIYGGYPPLPPLRARWKFDRQEVQKSHPLGEYLQGNPLKFYTSSQSRLQKKMFDTFSSEGLLTSCQIYVEITHYPINNLYLRETH